MKVELTDLSPVKKSMSVVVDAEEVAKETATIVEGYAQKANIPGFRRGKVPKTVIRARFAKEVEEDVRERVVARFFHEAARERELQPLGNPTLDDVEHEAGQPLTFKTTFEILPEFELKDYKGVEASRPPDTVADDEVDKAMEEIRQARVNLVTEEGRKAGTGDVVVADVTGTPEGGEPFNRERMMIEVGSTENLPAFNEGLEGAGSGDELEFPVDYPAEYQAENLAGKTVRYRLAVHEVKRRELPDLDDEFAKDLGDFESLEQLRAKVREDLQHRKRHASEGAVRQQILDKVLLENAIVLPEILVEEEIRHRLEEIVRRMYAQGIDPEKAEFDWKELRKQQEAGAQKSVHARLVLDAVAKAESISVEQSEVDERLRRDAQAMGEAPEKLRATLKKQGGMEVLKNQILREKSLDLLTSVANIQTEE
jgi:trigger factor